MLNSLHIRAFSRAVGVQTPRHAPLQRDSGEVIAALKSHQQELKETKPQHHVVLEVVAVNCSSFIAETRAQTLVPIVLNWTLGQAVRFGW